MHKPTNPPKLTLLTFRSQRAPLCLHFRNGVLYSNILVYLRSFCVQMPSSAALWHLLESKLPLPIDALSTCRVVKVGRGAQHPAAVTACGNLISWGRGIEGQLGHASPHLPLEVKDVVTGIQLRPKPVCWPFWQQRNAAAQPRMSCEHNFTVVVIRADKAWAFEEGAMGRLGVGRATRASVPTMVMPACPVTGEPFVEVAAGWAHTLARTIIGRVFFGDLTPWVCLAWETVAHD